MEETLTEAKLRRTFNDIKAAHLDSLRTAQDFYNTRPSSRVITHIDRARGILTISS